MQKHLLKVDVSNHSASLLYGAEYNVFIEPSFIRCYLADQILWTWL